MTNEARPDPLSALYGAPALAMPAL
jgi:hypothetical protein